MSNSSKLKVRRSEDRGYANLGWLDTHHTFSFATYFDPKFEGWSSLRVLNEDRVSPSSGFCTHGHKDFEIFTYVLSGAIEHKDSLGNREVLRRGDVQFFSAGSGIRHSEYNYSDQEELHFLQCMIQPSQKGLKPNYQAQHFTDEDKRGDPLLTFLSVLFHHSS